MRAALFVGAMGCGALGCTTVAGATEGDKLSLGIVNLDVSSLTANSFAVAVEAVMKKIGASR